MALLHRDFKINNCSPMTLISVTSNSTEQGAVVPNEQPPAVTGQQQQAPQKQPSTEPKFFAAIFRARNTHLLAVTEIQSLQTLSNAIRTLNYHQFWQEPDRQSIGTVLIPIIDNGDSLMIELTLNAGIPCQVKLFNNQRMKPLNRTRVRFLSQQIYKALLEHHPNPPRVSGEVRVLIPEPQKKRSKVAFAKHAVEDKLASVSSIDDLEEHQVNHDTVKPRAGIAVAPEQQEQAEPAPDQPLSVIQESVVRYAVFMFVGLGPESHLVNSGTALSVTTYRQNLIKKLPKRCEWASLSNIPQTIDYQPSEVEDVTFKKLKFYERKTLLDRLKHHPLTISFRSILGMMFVIKRQVISPDAQHFHNATANKMSFFAVFFVGFLLGVTALLAFGFFTASHVTFPLTLAGSWLFAKYAFTTGLTLTYAFQMVMAGIVGISVCALFRTYRLQMMRYFRYGYTEPHDVRHFKTIEPLRLSLLAAAGPKFKADKQAISVATWKERLQLKSEDDLDALDLKSKRWHGLLRWLNAKADKHKTFACPNLSTLANLDLYQRVRSRLKHGDLQHVKDALEDLYVSKKKHADDVEIQLKERGYLEEANKTWFSTLENALIQVEAQEDQRLELLKKTAKEGELESEKLQRQFFEKLLNKAIALVQKKQNKPIQVSFTHFAPTPQTKNFINSQCYFGSVSRLWLEQKMLKKLEENLKDWGFEDIVTRHRDDTVPSMSSSSLGSQ